MHRRPCGPVSITVLDRPEPRSLKTIRPSRLAEATVEESGEIATEKITVRVALQERLRLDRGRVPHLDGAVLPGGGQDPAVAT